MDEVDYANDLSEKRLAMLIKQARNKPMRKGQPGDCDLCGEYTSRLVEGVCCPCRDRYKLK